MESQQIIIHLTKCRSTLRNVSSRICNFISEALEIPIVDTPELAKLFTKGNHIVYLVNSSYRFCEFREDFHKIIENAAKVFYICIDYTEKPDSRYKKYITEVWTTVEGYSTNSVYFNWNKISMYDLELREHSTRRDGLFYYGSYRAGREEYFKKYLFTDLYQVWLSIDRRKSTEFMSLGHPTPKIYKEISDWNQLVIFKNALYIEDKETHLQFHSPANRFYEYLSARHAIIFDVGCINTFNKVGIDISRFCASSVEQVNELLSSSGEIAEGQNRLWFKDYRAEAKKELLTLVKRKLL